MCPRYTRKTKPLISDAFRGRHGYDVLLDAGMSLELAPWFRYGSVFMPADYELAPKARDSTIVAVAHDA
jgi:hypothetical protein